jgi:hypothetical protein
MPRGKTTEPLKPGDISHEECRLVLNELGAESHNAFGQHGRLLLGWCCSTAIHDLVVNSTGNHPFLYLDGSWSDDMARWTVWTCANGISPVTEANGTWRALARQKTSAPLWVKGSYQRGSKPYGRPLLITNGFADAPGELTVTCDTTNLIAIERIMGLQDSAAEAVNHLKLNRDWWSDNFAEQVRNCAKHAISLGYKYNPGAMAVSMACYIMALGGAHVPAELFPEPPKPKPLTLLDAYWMGVKEMYEARELCCSAAWRLSGLPRSTPRPTDTLGVTPT